MLSLDDLNVDNEIIEYLKNQKDIEIDKYSDKGGNGELFFGINKLLQKRIAIKFYAIDPNGLAHNEVRSLSKIKCDNILEVLHANIIGKNYACFFTPEIEGGDLDRYIKENGIDIYKAIHITKGMLKGIIALQDKKFRLVHRDLKPGNILVDKNCNPYIADFGSIKMIPDGFTSIEGSQHCILYRPPESFISNTYYFNSDIYQIGIIMYQLLGGYFPYDASKWMNNKQYKVYNSLCGEFEKSKYFDSILGNLICQGKIINNNSLPDYVSSQLIRIINRATNNKLEKRYQNPAEFMTDIYRFMKNSVNWISCPDSLIVMKANKPIYKIVNKSLKGVQVYKKAKNVWRKCNIFSNELKDIAEKINNGVTY